MVEDVKKPWTSTAMSSDSTWASTGAAHQRTPVCHLAIGRHASAARIRFQRAESALLAQKTCSIYLHIGVGMDELFQEFKSRGVEIVEEPN